MTPHPSDPLDRYVFLFLLSIINTLIYYYLLSITLLVISMLYNEGYLDELSFNGM